MRSERQGHVRGVEQDRNARYRRTVKGRYQKLGARARERSLEMALTLAQYTNLISGPCTYCLGPLPEAGYGLDRKDSSRGYLNDNVVPCCGDCNAIKSDILTYEEMRFLMGQLRRLRAGKSSRI